MLEKGHIPTIPIGIIEGEVDGYRYFFNPRGHKGVLVLFGEALEVLNCCKNGLTIDGIKGSLPWAKENPDRVDKIIDALGRAELINLGKEYSQKLHVERHKTTPKLMDVWLQVTDACNLRCDYCCISKKPTRMGLDMAKKLVEKIAIDAGLAGYEEVLVKLAGGEPTLFWTDVKALIDWAEIRFADFSPKIKFHVITNGTFLAQTFIDYLKQKKVGVSISLDGVGAWHDVQRSYASGGGSFDRIDVNISRLLAEGIQFNILAVITKKSAGGLTELAKYCIDRGLPFRFNFCSDPATFSDGLEGYNEELIRELKRCYSWIAQNLPKKNLQFLHKFADTSFDGPKSRNCGIGSNTITIGCDGNASICQAEIGVSLGNVLEQDAIRLVTEQTHYDLAASRIDQISECRDCKWRYACGGGCPLLSKQHFGSDGHASPYCRVYKEIFPILIELFAVQLIEGFKKQKP